MGTRSRGSKSFLMASQMKMPPTIIIMMLGMVALAKPVYDKKSKNLVEMNSNVPISLSYGYQGGTFHHGVATGY